MRSSFEDLEVWEKSCKLSVRLYISQEVNIFSGFRCERIDSRVESNIQNASIVA